MGAEAERLGLAGREVQEETLHRALSWSDPRHRRRARRARSGRRGCPGFDLMFSVPKSASVLFGIGEKDVRTTIRRAQEEAVGQALAVPRVGRVPRTDGRGRAGRGRSPAAGSSRPRSSTGRPAPAIRSSTRTSWSRTRSQRPDGQWAALDGRLIYAHAKTAGYIHEAAFRRALARDLGVRVGAAGQRHRRHPRRLAATCSTRSAAGAARSTPTCASAARAAPRRARSPRCGRARPRTTASRRRSCCPSGVSARRALGLTPQRVERLCSAAQAATRRRSTTSG